MPSLKDLPEDFVCEFAVLRPEDVEFARRSDLPVVQSMNVGTAGARLRARRGADPKDVLAGIFLSWLLQNAADQDVIFSGMDNLYADLDYPEEMKSLATYMPSKDPEPSSEKLEAAIRKYHAVVLARAFEAV